jgi:hypothetical protein
MGSDDFSSAKSPNYTKLKSMCEACGVTKGKQSDEYLFTLNAVDLFYYKKNIGQVDIKTGFIDGPNDGGIDFIYSDGESLCLIQGKSSSALSFEDIKNVYNKMSETVNKFEDRDFDGFSSLLKSAYRNAYDNLSDEKNIELILFTNTEINDKIRAEVEKLSKNNQNLKRYKLSIYDQDDIKLRDAIIETDSDLVDEDKITIWLGDDKNSNMLKYGNNGIIVNVMASSVKRLYEKYGKSGLFSYNLREYISQKNVDEGIEETIKKDNKNFWFYNNGITIGCRDFAKDGNTIKLYNFSIINGAQTTTKIGKSRLVNEKIENDFALVCKIVKDDKMSHEFITKISESSNSQKPVKQRDLKANTSEQRRLQNESATNGDYSLSIEIKRGVHPANYKKVDKWRRITNEYLGQLIYACLLQHPGPARNSKNAIFSSKKLYTQIFMRKHDYNTLYDMVRIAHIYDEFVEEFVPRSNDNDTQKIALMKNGKFTIISIAFYLYKKQQGIVDSYLSDKVRKDNISGLLITDYDGDDLDKKLKALFNFIVRIVDQIYDANAHKLKVTSYSNFFKAETNYEIILQKFDDLDDYDKDKIETLMTVFTNKKVI